MKKLFTLLISMAILAGISYGFVFSPDNTGNNKSVLFSNPNLNPIGFNSQSPQTSLINEGFESGNVFTLVNGTQINQWVVNTAVAQTGSYSLYVTNNTAGTPPPATYTVTTASNQVVHAYIDVAIPAGETDIQLTFWLKGNGESTYDRVRIYDVGTSTTPVAGTELGSGQVGLVNYSAQGEWIRCGILISSSEAGTTRRIVISWRNDTSTGTGESVAIDNIKLTSATPSALSGTYTIDNTTATGGTNFNDFVDAILRLNSDGVSAAVTFNVTAGQTYYNLNPVITATGTSGNTITFQKTGGTNPLIKTGGQTSATAPLDAGISIAGGDYFTFDGIDIAATTNAVYYYVDAGYYIYNASTTNGAQYNTIKNTKITLNRTNTSSRGIYQNVASTPASAAGANTGNKYYNITIENVYAGVQLLGNATYPDDGCEIGVTGGGTTTIGSAVANDIGNGSSATYGVQLTGQKNVKVFNTEIRNITGTSTSTVDGIFMVNTGSTTTSVGTCEIYNNKIHDLNNTSTSTTAHKVTGIRSNLTGASGSISNVYNNFIYGLQNSSGLTTTARQIIGIWVQDAGSGVGAVQNISFNSVRLESAKLTYSNACYEIGTTSGPVINTRDNIFSNFTAAQTGTVKHYTWVSTGTAAIGNTGSVSNYNDLYINNTTNGYVGLGNTTDYATLANWQTAMVGQDVNSFSSNPPFTSTTDLHIPDGTTTQLESSGTTIAGILNDIDGTARNVSTPDIGADEFIGLPAVNMSYSSSTTDQVTGLAYPGINNQSIIRIKVVTTGSLSPISATSFTVNANGTTAITDINATTAKIYYTGASTTFSTGTLFGGTTPTITPDFVVTGTQTLSEGNNYFWLAYDVIPGATGGNFIDGECNSVTVAATPHTPTVTAPAGNRVIGGPLSGDYTISATMFNQLTGKNITFEKVTKKVTKEVLVEEPVINKETKKGEIIKPETNTSSTVKSRKELREVEEISWVAMENGKKYDGPLFVKKSEHPEYFPNSPLSGVYVTITAAVADLNGLGISGPTRFLLASSSYTTGETYPITVNVAINKPTITNTFTIKPDASMTSSITGVAANVPIFKIFNTNYVTIDGSNGTTSRDLTITNSSPTVPSVIWIGSSGTTPITNVAVKNCILINGANTNTAVIISDGNTSGTAGYFNNITIQNNSIQKAYIGIYNTAVVATGNGSGLLVTQNDINTSGANAVSGVGIYAQGVDGATVTNNNIANFADVLAYKYGIWFATGTVNSSISNNNIGPITTANTYYPTGIILTPGVTASNNTVTGNTIHDLSNTSTGDAVTGINAGGGGASGGIKINKNLIYNISCQNTGGYGAWGINLASTLTASNIEVSNNMIYNVNSYGYGTGSYENSVGILCYSGGGYNIYYNSVDLYTNQGAGQSFCLMVYSSSISSLNIRNNIFANNLTTFSNYCVYSAAANTAFTDINYNDYYAASATNGYVGYLGSNRFNLAAWQSATLKDANSVSGDPKFLGGANTLHINTALSSPVSNAGTYISSVLDDIDNQTRNRGAGFSEPNPDIGADEYTYVPPPEPTFSIVPTSKDFGNILVGQVSADQTFTITNTGGADLHISSTTLAGTDPTQFFKTDLNTYTLTIAPLGTAIVKVRFTPTSTGAKNALLSFVDDATGSPHTVALTGKGVPIYTLPYTETFDAGKILSDWSSSAISGTNEWVVGTPAKTQISGAHSAPNAYVTLITGNTQDNANEYVLSPIFNFTSSYPMLSFWHNFYTEAGYDACVVEYTTDMGANWTKLDANLGTGGDFHTDLSTNWYNSNSTYGPMTPPKFSGTSTAYTGNTSGWIHSVSNLIALSGQSTVQFRFRYASDGSSAYEGWAIDDFELYNQPSMVVVSSTSTQTVTSPIPVGATDQQIIGVEIVTSGVVPISATSFEFNSYGCKDVIDLANAKLYYTGTSNTFATTTLVGQTSVFGTAGDPFTITGSQALLTGTNHFWLAYDIAPSGTATAGDLVDAGLQNITVGGSIYVPDVTDPGSGRLLTEDKQISSFTVTQSNSSTVTKGSTNNDVLMLDFNVGGTSGTLNLNSIVVNYNGTDALDIPASGVKLYRTTTPVFSTANPLGTAQSLTTGNATFSSLAYDLPTGNTYVWVAFDVSSTATTGNLVDAQIELNTIDVAGTTYPATTQNPAGTRTIILYCPVITPPFTQDFELATFPPECWTETASGTIHWARTTAASGYGIGTASAFVNFYNASSGTTMDLVTNTFDISSLANPKLKFDHAYATYSGEVDQLEILYSINDGSSYTSLIVYAGGAGGPLNTGGTVGGSFIPTAGQWATKSISLPAGTNKIMFHAISDYGNNLYVDNITVANQPAIDLAFTQFYQASGTMKSSDRENFTDYKVTMSKPKSKDDKPQMDKQNGNKKKDEKQKNDKRFLAFTNNGKGVKSTVNNTNSSQINKTDNPLNNKINKKPFLNDTKDNFINTNNNGNKEKLLLANINVNSRVTNNGTSAASYLLDWIVGGVAQTQFSGPSVSPGLYDDETHVYTPSAIGTFLTTGSITVAGDEMPANNTAAPFRLRAYPEIFTRTIYDRGDNEVNTNIGYNNAASRCIAAVRYTPTSSVQLAGVDFIFSTETVTSGTMIVNVCAAGSVPGPVLYTKTYNTADYLPAGGNDYIFFPFDAATAPVFAPGTDYWITIETPLGVLYPFGAHTSGFTTGRSYVSNDGSTWSPLIIGSTEYAWIMRSVETAAPMLNLTALIQGFYDNVSNSMNPTDITVELRNSTTYGLVDSKTVTLDATGTATPVFTIAKNSTPYYIVIKHRNGIETWSATPQSFTGSALTYDFTSAATQAYGSNMVLKGTKWCIYNGDITQDGSCDLNDIIPIIADYEAWDYHIQNDVNGDGSIDLNDVPVIIYNYEQWVGPIIPGKMVDNSKRNRETIPKLIMDKLKQTTKDKINQNDKKQKINK